jgi:pSer/pThr/pTyr-binding forkhead associated (FHA) protein
MPPLPFSTYPDRHTYTMAPSFYHPDGQYSAYSAPPPSPITADTQLKAVTITLRSTRPTNFQTRNITLRPDEPVNVGRSSRSEAKNLSATANNALFDCPVISRRHAEFELRLNKWTEEKYLIFIKDTGSMHGTSVNGLKLVPSKPFKLKEGDTIRLGESVNRADSECLCKMPGSSHADTIVDNYDGVTVTLQHIANATTKTTPQVKSSQQGISVPSDSESDFDDEGDSDGGAAHTTPDGGNVKSVPQPQTGSSCSHSIMVDEDEDDDALFTRRAPAQLNFIPDTYADNSVMVAVSRGSIPTRQTRHARRTSP